MSATESTSFTFERNGNPLTLNVTATFSLRTQQVVYNVVTSNGQSILRDGSLNAITDAFKRFGTVSPGDASAAQAASNWAIQAANTLKGPEIAPLPSAATSDTESKGENQQSDDQGQTDQAKVVTRSVSATASETIPSGTTNSSLSNTGTQLEGNKITGSENGAGSATVAGSIANVPGRANPGVSADAVPDRFTPGVGGEQVRPNNQGPYRVEARLDAAPPPQPTTGAQQLVSRRLYNPLSEFSSVAYKISLYLITPEAYNNFYATGKWVTSSLELILQSGGITTGVDSPRNKYFNYDFYIDNLEIATLINGKETGTATNSVDFKFQIIEPYTMTFPSRLVQAQVELQQKTNIKAKVKQQVQALNSPLLLVIRFYGYDNAGDVVTKINNPDAKYSKTDTSAAFERAFPIIITKMGFKLDNKTTVYECQAKPINEQIGLGTKRGIVNTLINIKADTVENALSHISPNGLMAQLNKQQEQLTNKPEKEKKQKIADVYKVAIVSPSIGYSLIVDKDFYVKSRAPTANVTNAADVNVRTAQRTQTVDKDKRVIEIPPGQSIMSAIDQIISQSTYLKRSMKILDGEEILPTKENEGEYTVNGQPLPLQWYSVVPQIKIIGYDDLRNDYAYEITYIIQRYNVPYIRSIATGGTSTSYTGPSKIYNYYYTGDNQEILAYEQQYNLLYFNAASLTSEAANGNNNDPAPNITMPAQNANPTGKSSGSFEQLNNVKTFLYSPGDQIRAQIKILGDPDFIMPAVAGSIQTATEAVKGEDFAINPSTGQVFIEVDFKQVEDYGASVDANGQVKFNDDGLLSPNGNIKFWDYPPAIEAVTKGRMVYMVTKVTSRFSKGTFTQDLRSILPSFPNVETTAASNTQRQPAAGAAASSQNNGRSVNTGTGTGATNNGAGGGQSTPQFAAIDPRRLDLPTNVAASPVVPRTQASSQDDNPNAGNYIDYTF